MVPLDAFSIGMFSTLVFCQHGYSAYDVCIHNFADGVNFCRNFYLRFFFLRIVEKTLKAAKVKNRQNLIQQDIDKWANKLTCCISLYSAGYQNDININNNSIQQ